MSADEYKTLGNQAFTNKEFEKAAELFTKAIEASASPNHVLYSNRSACYTSSKQFDKALEDANECVKINPTWAKGYNRVGAAQYGQGDFEGAKQSYNKALELDPANKMAKEGVEAASDALDAGASGLGNMFSDPALISKLMTNPKTAEMMKDPGLVAKVMQLQSNPQSMLTEMMSDQRLMTVMGVAMGVDIGGPPPAGFNADNVPSADVEMKDAPAETPKTETKPEPVPEPTPEPEDQSVALKAEADGYKAEANKLYKSRKFDEAIELYDKAWETFKDITYLNNRAAAEYEKGDYDTAIKTCETAVDEGRDMRADYKLIAKAFARIGTTYVKKDDLQSAIKFFEKSLTEHRTPDTLNKLRSAEKELKKREQDAYVDPAKAEEARLEGKEYFTKGDWPNAVKSYTEMVNRAPEDPRGYSNRAAALAKLMSFPEAVRDCDKAIAKDPNFIRAYIRKATSLLAMKEYTKCIDTLAEARTKDAELGGASSREIEQLSQKALSARFTAVEGETQEETQARISRDPEVVEILQDPVMNSILQQARDNPAALQEHMKNPDVYKKVMTLMAAGVIRTR
ncbi:unnamed protein product [Kuraishia capsulata CBS 1993]|uniref:STI1 domain-containing protein n=1 Tax=Kuraishia capsulata CBS 1993 TaxID=1382522 RepID=W6MMS0_9ASCO|nr:uncharacterized protein KUCA_T00003471001 [Kuraishia capsulata CBS 1993]CDK27493.1 unnamed protein product [Kuraishia capsulata CBS 1993]